MWPKQYQDYTEDTPLKQEKLEPGKGIVGCEMHDLQGWGNTLHQPPKPKRKGIIRTLIESLFGTDPSREDYGADR